MRNISGEQSNNVESADGLTGRSALERELIEEMTSWSPHDRGYGFKMWHRHAISLVHLNVLTTLEAEGPLSMKRLAELIDVSDAGATGIVDRMEKRGLVERRHGTGDRRVVLVHATDAGAKVFGEMDDHRREVLRAVLSQVLAELTEEEMASLLVGMRAVHAAHIRLLATSGPDCPDRAASVAPSGPHGKGDDPAAPVLLSDDAQPPVEDRAPMNRQDAGR